MKNSVYNSVKCYHSHPALPLKDGLVIYGGSCSSPAVGDADVYVGFDYSMPNNDRAYPWNDGVWFNFPIQDMHAPADPEEFSRLIDWLILQLSANKKVHIGCIGGHGRTGTVLAALVARFLGRKDAIEYVRKNYCEKAVESQSQIDFLVKHFGVESASPAKESFLTYSDQWSKKYDGRVPKVTKKLDPKEIVGTTTGRVSSKTTAKMTLSAAPAFRPTQMASVPSVWAHGVKVFGAKFAK